MRISPFVILGFIAAIIGCVANEFSRGLAVFYAGVAILCAAFYWLFREDKQDD